MTMTMTLLRTTMLNRYRSASSFCLVDPHRQCPRISAPTSHCSKNGVFTQVCGFSFHNPTVSVVTRREWDMSSVPKNGSEHGSQVLFWTITGATATSLRRYLTLSPNIPISPQTSAHTAPYHNSLYKKLLLHVSTVHHNTKNCLGLRLSHLPYRDPSRRRR